MIHYDRFKARPVETEAYTMVTCIHPYHGIEMYYLSAEDFQDNIRGILSPFWVNGYTVIMQAM